MKETTRCYIRQRDDWTCWRCGAVQVVQSPYACDVRSPVPGLPNYLFVFDVDHLIPRSHGGTDDEWNLALSCGLCNRSRQDALEPAALRLANRQKLEWYGFV
jgi:5-methylcytosine-specific restriction endonuclease McrA